MAKKYRTEREILTIELPVEISAEHSPEGVSPEKSTILKISAYPAVWRRLHEIYLYGDRREIDDIIEKAIEEAHNKIPQKRIKQKDIKKDDFGTAFDYQTNRDERIASGKHYRGTHKLKHKVTNEIKDKARWLHWFFRFWEKRKQQRPANVQLIYDGIKAKAGRATIDPTALTYFCCQLLYEEKFRDLNQPFPSQDSFRTTYLKERGLRIRRNMEEVMQLVEKQGHPLNIIAETCRKLQK